MSDTSFAQLAYLGEQLEHTTKRREMVALLAQFLQGLVPEEIAPAVRLTIGRVFPEWDEQTLNVSWAAVMVVLDKLTNESPDIRDQLSAQAVDGGEFVRLLLEQVRSQPPDPPPLTILEVFQPAGIRLDLKRLVMRVRN